MKTKELISFRENNKGAYFFIPGCSALQRRKNEEKNSFDVSTTWDGHVVRVVSAWTESCKNVYYDFSIYVDGIKKDLRALRKLPGDLEFN